MLRGIPQRGFGLRCEPRVGVSAAKKCSKTPIRPRAVLSFLQPGGMPGFLLGLRMQSRNAQARRQWWRLHIATLFALAMVGSALGFCETQTAPGARLTWVDQRATFTDGDCGWPLRCLDLITPGRSAAVTDVRWQSDPLAALVDLATVVLMLISTVVACEVWRRRKLAWWQFSVRSFFVLTAVGSVVATLYLNPISAAWCRSELHPKGQTVYHCGLTDSAFAPTPWYVSGAMLFGIGCVVFTTGWAVSSMAIAMWRMARRRIAMRRGPIS